METFFKTIGGPTLKRYVSGGNQMFLNNKVHIKFVTNQIQFVISLIITKTNQTNVFFS